MFFRDVVGHQRTIERLRELLSEGRLPQALLLVGPANVGKSLLLRCLAQAIQATNGEGPDGPTARMVEMGSHPDTLIIPDDGESVTIEQVRALTSRLALTGQSAAKIAIIEDIGRITRDGQGALLKTLEEPTGRTHFLLTSRALEDVLPTIRSRSTVVPVSLVTDEETATLLPRTLDAASRAGMLLLADGRPGRLLTSLQGTNAEEMLARLADVRGLLTTPDLIGRMTLLAAASDSFEDPVGFCDVLLLVLRRVLRTGGLEGKRAQRATRLVIDALSDLRTNARARLILEDLVVHLPVFDRVPT